jgi:hypothetical protein
LATRVAEPPPWPISHTCAFFPSFLIPFIFSLCIIFGSKKMVCQIQNHHRGRLFICSFSIVDDVVY